MNNIEIEQVVATVYEQFLSAHRTVELKLNGGEFPRSLRADTGYAAYGTYFKFHMDVENFGYEKDGTIRHPEWQRRCVKNLHIIITQHHNVFIAVSDGVKNLRDVPNNEWLNTSNHDSCWREDGLRLIRQTIYDAYTHCYGSMPEEHKPTPAAMTMFSRLGAGFVNGDALQFVRVDFQSIDPDDSYFKRVTKVMPVKFEINIIDGE
jgi:hypothetical protein